MSAACNTTVPLRPFANYAAYSAWFQAQYAAFRLPENATECGPFKGPTSLPQRPPWKLQWWIIFSDGTFLSCSEYFEVNKKHGPDAGMLTQFSYHYGRHPGITDKNGCPKHSLSKDTFIRIDLAPHFADHIHFNGEDHIPQGRLKGDLIIVNTMMFDFIAKILRHKKEGTSLSECFGFEVL